MSEEGTYTCCPRVAEDLFDEIYNGKESRVPSVKAIESIYSLKCAGKAVQVKVITELPA